MTNKFHAQAKDGALIFGSDYSRATFKEFLKKNEGIFLTIEPREKISRESRGYFEGALIPSYIVWSGGNPHDKAKVEEIRELFKLEFNSGVVKGLDGNMVKIPLSTAKLSRQEFRDNFIADIVDYFIENNIPVPNPELYKEWRDHWSIEMDELLTFWEFLEKYGIKCDAEVGTVDNLIATNAPKG